MFGYRTYIVAGLMGLTAVARGLGFLDEGMYQMVMGFLTGGGIATLRAGVKNDTTEVKKEVRNAP